MSPPAEIIAWVLEAAIVAYAISPAIVLYAMAMDWLDYRRR